VNDNLPWSARLAELVARVYHHHPAVRILGVCFGHQLVCRALGGQVETNPKGWEIGWTEITLSSNAKRFLRTQRECVRLMSMHQVGYVKMKKSYS
jgi:GMP synthase-like glutamine amidotransferase